MTAPSMTTTTTPQQSDDNASVDENWCHTRMVVSNHCYRWTIHDFSTHREKLGSNLESSTFSTGTDGKIKWCLQLFRDYAVLPSNRDNRVAVFSVALRLVSCQWSNIYVDCRVSILNSKGQEAATKSLSRRFYPGAEKPVTLSGESDPWVEVSNAVAPDDTVTLCCKMDLFVGPVNVPGEKKSILVPEGQLSPDLGHLFEDGKFSDVVLNVQGKEIHAHKMILAARSVVFASMFQHDMEEKKKNLIEIADLDYETIRETLRFMYTDQARNIDARAEDLLAAADKYSLDRLKAMCEESLCSKMSVESAATLLFLADMHSAEQLKALAMGFIQTHVKDVVKTSGWKTLIQRRPQLIDEVFRAFAIEKCLLEYCQENK